MAEFERKKLPVGIDSFEKIRSLDFYYVDKTAMIRDLLQRWGKSIFLPVRDVSEKY